MDSGSAVPKPKSRGVLDHIIVLMANQRPVDGLCQNWLEVGVSIDMTGMWSGKLLRGNRLETRHQVEAQEMAKRERDFTLPMTIDVVLLDLHLRAMPQDTFNHGSDLEEEQRLSCE